MAIGAYLAAQRNLALLRDGARGVDGLGGPAEEFEVMDGVLAATFGFTRFATR